MVVWNILYRAFVHSLQSIFQDFPGGVNGRGKYPCPRDVPNHLVPKNQTGLLLVVNVSHEHRKQCEADVYAFYSPKFDIFFPQICG